MANLDLSILNTLGNDISASKVRKGDVLISSSLLSNAKVMKGDVEVLKVMLGDNKIWELPAEGVLPYDAQVEYLRFDGSQYINTNIFPTSLNLTLEYRSKNHIEWGWVYNNQANNTWIGSIISTVYWKNWNSSYKYRLDNPFDDTIHTWKHDMQNGLYKDGTLLKSFTTSLGNTQISSIPLVIGKNYDGYDQTIKDITFSSDKYFDLYSLKIWAGTDLIRDYIPVRVGTVGYLYDKVSGRLFGNAAASGAFSYGNDVNT